MTRLILVVHIAFGAAGLVLGPIAMLAPKRRGRHTVTGEAYHWVVLGVCVTAAALAVLDWSRNWWFLPIAVGSYAFALLGYVTAKRRRGSWLISHVTGQGGSYIAMVTALLVVNWSLVTGTPGRAAFWPWFLPAIVGTTILTWVNAQIRRGKRPRVSGPRRPAC